MAQCYVQLWRHVSIQCKIVFLPSVFYRYVHMVRRLSGVYMKKCGKESF